ncbi:hypothetical protein J3458_004954 [Metarhizium acridum]|uniref:uncharacterized protein n=1 Tax=Metarhizium acridum TaxID=92637 RepID=UPI001C6CA875|nr:hypothetical protein J3458_004954 [Metarhizium acridum]
MKAAADSNFKKVSLELGGKSPSIVFPDADLANALFWTTLGITANNGQVCAAGSRIYVHSSLYEEFLRSFGEKIAQSSPGDPLLPETTKGPIVNKKQMSRILGYITHAKDSGLRVIGGTENITSPGYFVSSVAFADVPNDSRLMQEEIFGPVASIAKFETEGEVIGLANNSSYGLSAAIFTSNIHRADRVSAALESGQVTVNCWGLLNANAPFGGVKESGFGRDMGQEALEDWLVTKTVKHNILPAKGEETLG